MIYPKKKVVEHDWFIGTIGTMWFTVMLEYQSKNWSAPRKGALEFANYSPLAKIWMVGWTQQTIL